MLMVMRIALPALIASLCLAGTAVAGDLTVSVRTPTGAPVKDAVVMLQPPAGAPARPVRFSWPMTESQHNIQFDPFVLVVPVGSAVTFPNLDRVRHHVYSFSPTKRFELKLYGQEQARTVVFDKVGVVALGCNIHDTMVAFIRVVDTPYAAKTNAAGDAVIRDAPAGGVTLTVWHPYLKTPRNEMQVKVAIGSGGGRQAVTADVRAPAAMPMMR
jgi:plastocyanin